MLKEQKKQVFVFGVMAVLSVSLATSVAKAALDIEKIDMCSQKDHLDGTPYSNPWRFEVCIDLVDPGTLHHINVTSPAGLILFTIYEDNGRWVHKSWPILYPTLTALQTVYPTGLYTFDFRDSTDSLIKSVELDYSGISEPGSAVDFTYPSYDGQTGINYNNPIFTWTIDSGAGDALGILLKDDDDNGIYDQIPAMMDVLSWQPGPLNPVQNYWLYVTVVNVKDWSGGPNWPVKSVGGDEFEYLLHIGYMNKIGFTTAPVTLSGWIYMPPGVPDFGYSLDEANLLYFFSSEPVLNYNINTGQWNTVGPEGWIYVNWPFIYELFTGHLWFALPPVSGLWVFHFCTGQWEMLPRIIP